MSIQKIKAAIRFTEAYKKYHDAHPAIRETMVKDRELVKSAFLTYFAMGGLQLNVNCFSKGDLERALEHPENYRNLIVRVSGYSAKFVDLDPITQRAIMARTLY